MAARRIAQVNINWGAFLERSPPTQAAQAQAFKIKVDGYVRKLASLPEKPPAIDWAYYKSRVGVAGMVDNFQKKYEALSIPFPTDTLSSKIEQDKQGAMKEASSFINEIDQDIKGIVAKLDHINKCIPFDEMTMEDFQEAYPELALNTFTRPSHWPHEPEELADAEEYVKTGKIPERLVIHDCH